MTDGLVATVAEEYRAELGLPGCSPGDSFFQLGGDSLLATRVLARLGERYAVRIPFAEMYRDSTPASIARVIEELRAAPRARRRSIASLARRRRRVWFPLSLSQEGLYAMNAATRGAGLFNNVGVLRFAGDIDPDALRAAVADTVRRQSALRLVFGEERGTPVQRFTDDLPVVETCDLRGQGAGLRRRIRRERLLGFDLHAGPPVRFALARAADDAWILVATLHHIVFDGMSQGLFADELAQAYARRVGDRPPNSPLSWDYADFAEWQRDTLRGERLEAHLDAIRAALPDTPPPRLAGTGAPSSSFLASARRFSIGADHTLGLRRLAASGDTTLFVALAAAVLDFVARRTADARPVVAIQAANRAVEGAEATVGCFANSVHVAVNRLDSLDPVEHVRQARDAVGAALRHQELPLESALRMLDERGAGIPGPEYLPQVGFALQPPRVEHRDLPGGALDATYVTEEGDSVDPTSFALVLELFSENGELDGMTHHRLAEWSDPAFSAAEADLSAAFARFGANPEYPL